MSHLHSYHLSRTTSLQLPSTTTTIITTTNHRRYRHSLSFLSLNQKQQPRSPSEFLALAAASRKQRMGDSNIHWHKSSKTNKTNKTSKQSSSSSSKMMTTTSEPLHSQTDLGRLTTGGHNLANGTAMGYYDIHYE
jgi:hypothetical protein